MSTLWKVEKIHILQNNFVFVLHRDSQAWVIDPGDATPVLDFLSAHGLVCKGILITHHHDDHIAGIPEILQHHPCPVYAPLKNKGQVPAATNFLVEGESMQLLNLEVQVWELPGHTLGHIAFWEPEKKWLFSGDVLFALGCGRLFEGTPAQMFQTLQRIKTLPDETLIFCTHDYFPSNSKFCRAQNFAFDDYDSILPLVLAQEKKFNPFLTAKSVEEFADIRQKRNLA